LDEAEWRMEGLGQPLLTDPITRIDPPRSLTRWVPHL
jgi:hypothetical protein